MSANARLLAWFEGRRASYPWRRSTDPYAVWVSEVMLQQTQAARVVPHFERFVARFPTVGSLAAAPRGEVVKAWDRLGYNPRAIALPAAAPVGGREHGGRPPGELRALPRPPP